MQLRASLVGQSRYDELLAVVEPKSDTPEPLSENGAGDVIRRTIVGTIKQRGPIWDDFIAFWSLFTAGHDSGPQLIVKTLQVDHDFYGNGSCLDVAGDTITLHLFERFDGSLDEYPAAVRERNNRVEAYLNRWNTFQITRNDVRILMGLEPKDESRFKEFLAPEVITDSRKLYWHYGVQRGLTRNIIV